MTDILDMIKRIQTEVFEEYGNLLDDKKQICQHTETRLTYLVSQLLQVIENEVNEYPKEDYIVKNEVVQEAHGVIWTRSFYNLMFLNEMLIAGYRAGYKDALKRQLDSRRLIIEEVQDEIQEKLQEMLKELS